MLPDVTVTPTSITFDFDFESDDLPDYYVIDYEPPTEDPEIILYTSPMEDGPKYSYTFDDLHPDRDYNFSIIPFENDVNGSAIFIPVNTSKTLQKIGKDTASKNDSESLYNIFSKYPCHCICSLLF